MKSARSPAATVISVGTLFPPSDQALVAYVSALAPAARSAQLLRMDRLCGLSLCVADQALLAPAAANRFDPATTAVVIGSAYGCHKSDEDFFRARLAGQPSPRLFSYTLPSSPVGEVSIHYSLLGPGLSIVTGRTAGLEALAQAHDFLSAGQASAGLILACEVAAPAVLERPLDAGLCDGAVAVLIGLPADRDAADSLGQLVDSATAFHANDPAAAVRECIDEIHERAPLSRGAVLICDPQTHALIGEAMNGVKLFETSPCGAAAAVAVFAGLSSLAAKSDAAGYLVLSVDPAGMAAVVLWRRTSAT